MGESLTEARSACFLTIVLSQMLHIFECRGKGLHFGGNRALMAAVSASVLCAVLCVYVPFLQPVFGTQAVWGRALWAVGGARSGGAGAYVCGPPGEKAGARAVTISSEKD